jgi:hypothetical protein
MGFVYFIQVIKTGDIKIGFSTNIKSRIHTLQTSIPESIKLLGFISGDLKLEKELHKKFKHLKKRGEWFHCDKSIIDYLNTCNEMINHTKMGVYIELLEDGKTQLYSKMKL